MNRSSVSPNNKAMGASKRYISPNERKPEEQQNMKSLADQSQISEVNSFMNKDLNGSKMSNMTQFANYMFIPCPTHPDLFITNLCQDLSCIEPLCPECITTHLEMHQSKGRTPKLENIQRVRKEQSKAIDEMIYKLNMKSKETQKYFKDLPNQKYQENLERLQQIHQSVMDVVDNYFSQLYNELKIQNVDKQKTELLTTDQELAQQISLLSQLQNGLHSDGYVKSVIQICESKGNLFNDKLIYKMDKSITDFETNLFKVGFEQRNLELLENNLKKTCYLHKQTQNQSASTSNQTTQRQPDIQSTFRSEFNQYSDILYIKPTNNIADILTNEAREFEINIRDHFQQDVEPTIVSLQEDSKIAYIYSIQSKQLKKESINSPNRVPTFHRLITTTQGYHLLIGGINKEKQRFKATPQVLQFDVKSLSLHQHSEMILPRALMAVCQVDDFIYVVGGTSSNDENTSIAKAEKMNISTRKWTSIADPAFKSSGSCLAQAGKYLVKLGGKSDIFTPCNQIETYNLSNDSWNTLDFKFASQGYLRLPFNACATNIGNNQILIIGGSVHDVKVEDTQILNLNDNTIKKSSQLPMPLEFNTQTAVIEYNQIYIINDEDSSILLGTSQGWRRL